jgi:hypothetical protein
MAIPPAPRQHRRLSDSVETTQHPRYQGRVSATARVRMMGFANPEDGPVFMVMRADPAAPGTWIGDCSIQSWGKDELEALANLFQELLDLHLDIDPAALAVAAELAAAPPLKGSGTRDSNGSREEWVLRPMGTRGPCPRRIRTSWRDRQTGQRIHIHTDTLRRHADPDCRCVHCTMLDESLDESPEGGQDDDS